MDRKITFTLIGNKSSDFHLIPQQDMCVPTLGHDNTHKLPPGLLNNVTHTVCHQRLVPAGPVPGAVLLLGINKYGTIQ